jgi:hypothetical protein
MSDLYEYRMIRIKRGGWRDLQRAIGDTTVQSHWM